MEDKKLSIDFIDDLYKEHLITSEQKQRLIEIVKKHNSSFGMNILGILVGILLRDVEAAKKKEE